jgi:uncharacterized protein YjbI with pentapeptide repeats
MKDLKQHIYEGLFNDDSVDELSKELNNYVEYTIGKVTTDEKIFITTEYYIAEHIRGVWVNGKEFDTDDILEIPFTNQKMTVRIALDSSIDSLGDLFKNKCMEYIDFSHFDGKNITDLSTTFSFCYNLKFINFADAFKNSKINKFDDGFRRCPNLRMIDLTGINLSEVTSIYRLFDKCDNLEEVNLTNVDFSKVKFAASAFDKCEKLERVIGFEKLNFKSLETADNMFVDCKSLKSINFGRNTLPMLKFADAMFANCENLKEVKGLDKFTGKNVLGYNISFIRMFENCALEKINLKNLNPQNEANFAKMFCGCKNLKSVDLSSLEDNPNYDFTKMFADVPYNIVIRNNINLKKRTFSHTI